MRLTTRLALAATLTADACFNPKLQEGVPCAEGDLCPDGQQCIDGLCFDEGGGDAGVDPSAALSQLLVSAGELDPPFDPQTTRYALDLGLGAADLVLTPTAADPAATITIGSATVASGADSDPQSLDFGPNTITITIDAGAGVTGTYEITADRGADFEQRAYVKASNTDARDDFGTSVAIDGDTVVVGAYLEDSNATGINNNENDDTAIQAGAAYVFVRSGDTWAQEAYLKASNTDGGDDFGFSVAISGDTIAVGAFDEASGNPANQNDNNVSGAGAVYVYRRSGTTWSQEAYLKAPTPANQDAFGISVAIDDDTLAVGAYREDGGGAVYVFRRSGTTWSQEQRLTASNQEQGDDFGIHVALSGDTLVGTALLEDSNATGINGNEASNTANAAGAAYVFTRVGATWSQQAYIKASNTESGDLFGASVALDGDTLAIGAIGEASSATGVNGNQTDNGANGAGAVYVYERTGSQWEQIAYLKASNTDTNDNFGGESSGALSQSIGLQGDLLVIGARLEDSSATGIDGNESDNSNPSSGAAYVFTRSGGVWSQARYVKPSNLGGSFGFAVDVSGGTVAIGAQTEQSAATGIDGNQDDTSATDAGALYLFE